MPRHTPRPQSERLVGIASIACSSLLDFLVPALSSETARANVSHRTKLRRRKTESASNSDISEYFFSSLARISECPRHRAPRRRHLDLSTRTRQLSHTRTQSIYESGKKHAQSPRHVRQLSTLNRLSALPDTGEGSESKTRAWTSMRTLRDLFDRETRTLKTSSHLPKGFFDDVFDMQLRTKDIAKPAADKGSSTKKSPGDQKSYSKEEDAARLEGVSADLSDQLKLLESVRELEQKLWKAKRDLEASLKKAETTHSNGRAFRPKPVTLTKEDYLGLVDLYFYTHRDRFHPEGKDYSPSPIFMEDYSFKLSSKLDSYSTRDDDVDAEFYENPLREIERALLNNKRREITVMQDFVDLLLDNRSSNRRLYHAYQRLPRPGVAYLPRGVIRLFLQRMSTPWVKSHGAMLRYLSLIDEMQEAKIPITQAEWSSAIYLAGRSMTNVTTEDVNAAMAMWRKMEREAGVQSTHVTFNILFDIAVRAGKFNLADSIMKEMWDRDLRLNRLGRVSLIFYHGIRADGDAVRQTYRDFVDAGEIVDTLVLNCVIASLLRAQEPTAAEQIFERMKDLQKRLETGERADGSETFFIRYPEASSHVIGREVASNHLGRILLTSSRLKELLPEHHKDLQEIMPLRPNHTTFRTLIAHHANVSGDLDRISVLLKEMMDDFGLPMRDVFYILLFKGFAIHSLPNNGDERWTSKRLDQVWDTCRNKIKENTGKDVSYFFSPAFQPDEEGWGPLPTLSEIEAAKQGIMDANETVVVGQKRLDLMQESALDLAAFPYQRRKPIERMHSLLFDNERERSEGFLDPFFPHEDPGPPRSQDMFYAIGNQEIDREEGEYVLPSPAQAAMGEHYRGPVEEDVGHDVLDAEVEPGVPDGSTSATRNSNTQGSHIPTVNNSDAIASATRPNELGETSKAQVPDIPERNEALTSFEGEGSPSHTDDVPDSSANIVRGNRAMFCWLLRAYTRTTRSRARVEEVYNSIRKIWIPKSMSDRIAVIKVMDRCQKDCDRYGYYRRS